MPTLMENVNLDSIEFTRNGTGLRFCFIDMNEGAPLARIDCGGVCVFKYQTAFDNDEGLPCYVGEVNVREIPEDSVAALLEKHAYGFADTSGQPYGTSCDKLHELNMESGEISLCVICTRPNVTQLDKP